MFWSSATSSEGSSGDSWVESVDVEAAKAGTGGRWVVGVGFAGAFSLSEAWESWLDAPAKGDPDAAGSGGWTGMGNSVCTILCVSGQPK
jgi:hypothetical protein